MHFISEAVARELLGIEEAIEVVENAFAALHRGLAQVFPVVSATGITSEDRWAIKSGRDLRAECVGCKIGTNWPRNRAQGMPTHASTVLLLDVDNGAVRTIMEATHLTALRTAAADAVAVRHLARQDATVLAVVGAGHQAYVDMQAICKVRSIDRIHVWSRTIDHAHRFVDRARCDGYPAEVSGLQETVAGSDVIVTATSAEAALFPAAWVRAGAHISAMGADAKGKQELAVPLVAGASLFTDSVEQSITIGEFQHAIAAGNCHAGQIRTLGSVIAGDVPGRVSVEQITIFDSSGMAIQDLAVCSRVAAKASSLGLGITV